MDSGTKWLMAILLLVGLIILDASWNRGYYLDQIAGVIRRAIR